MNAFGPVPSRRFGMSLGVNNIPAKQCTYSCVYCQLGLTRNLHAERKSFFEPAVLWWDVEQILKKLEHSKNKADYITVVSSGEPTLDYRIGDTIRLLKSFGIKIAVITNGSLLWIKEVQDALSEADCVSIKIDALSETRWQDINRPCRSLHLNTVLHGIVGFSHMYTGRLITETMLIKDMNDDFEELRNIAHFIAQLNPAVSYLAVPTRPPADAQAKPADASVITTASMLLRDLNATVDYLTNYEGNEFAVTDTIETMVMRITAVHPLREDALQELLKKTQSDWSVIEALVNNGSLRVETYNGRKYFIRKNAALLR